MIKSKYIFRIKVTFHEEIIRRVLRKNLEDSYEQFEIDIIRNSYQGIGNNIFPFTPVDFSVK